MCGGKNPDGPTKKTVAQDTPTVLQKTNITLPKRTPTRKFLDAILASKELTQALEAFLQSEFCLENLLFLQQVGLYKESFENTNLDSEATRKKQEQHREQIQKDFMLPSSETEVNIPAKIKKECMIQIENLKGQGLNMETKEYAELATNLFDACENHIKTTLVQERIGRFQGTEGFAKVANAVPVGV